MTVRAKMQLGYKAKNPNGDTRLNFYGVYSQDPASENKAFTDATPALNVSMVIAKDKPAADMFEQGKEYYLDFTPA